MPKFFEIIFQPEAVATSCASSLGLTTTSSFLPQSHLMVVVFNRRPQHLPAVRRPQALSHLPAWLFLAAFVHGVHASPPDIARRLQVPRLQIRKVLDVIVDKSLPKRNGLLLQFLSISRLLGLELLLIHHRLALEGHHRLGINAPAVPARRPSSPGPWRSPAGAAPSPLPGSLPCPIHRTGPWQPSARSCLGKAA